MSTEPTEPVDTGDPIVTFPDEPDVDQDTTPLDPDPDDDDEGVVPV